jgi:hypothetical protein
VRLEIKPVADKTVSIRADIKAKSRLIESSVASVSGQAFRTRGNQQDLQREKRL